MPPLSYPPTHQVINKKRGRPFGAVNKTSESIRWGFVEAYRQLGGVDGLVSWGRENPSLFYPMLKALLPHELAESGLAGNITVIVQRGASSKDTEAINLLAIPQQDEAGGFSAGPGVPQGNPSGTAAHSIDGQAAHPVEGQAAPPMDGQGEDEPGVDYYTHL